MIFTRFDTCEGLGAPVELPNGYLRVDAYISRQGCQTYFRDGKEYVEYRPPEEVFHADTLDSFGAVPLTNDHPSVALNAHNTSAYQIGSVLNPRQDGTRTRATILVTDAKAIEALRKGKNQLSCGYQCTLEESEGVAPDGTRYSAIQRAIRGNHVAVVDAARGGPELRMRLDASGHVLPEAAILDGVDKVDVTSPIPTTTPKESEVIVDELKKAIESLTAANARADAAEKALVALQASADKTQARADSLEAEVKALPAKIQAQVAARTALESKAKAALPGVVTDGKTDAEIKRQVIESRGTVKCDGRSEAYLDAAFDLTCDLETREDSAPIADVVEQDDNDAVSKAQKAFAARMDASFKKSAV